MGFPLKCLAALVAGRQALSLHSDTTIAFPARESRAQSRRPMMKMLLYHLWRLAARLGLTAARRSRRGPASGKQQPPACRSRAQQHPEERIAGGLILPLTACAVASTNDGAMERWAVMVPLPATSSGS